MPDRPPPEPETGPARGLRDRRRLVLAGLGAVLLTVLLAVVAAGTQAHYSQQVLPPAQAGATLNPVTGALGQIATVIVLGGAELMLVLAVVFFPWRDFKSIGKPTPVPLRMKRRDSLKLVGLAFGTLIALIVLLALGLKRRKKPFSPKGPAGTGSGAHHLTRVAGSVPVGSDLLAATAAVLVVILVVGTWLWLRARRQSHWRSLTSGMDPVAELPEEMASALTGGLEELAGGGDPRSAVILAYSRMERALADRGLQRRHFETHLEYLERALAGVHLSRQALSRLTELFQAARYSDHEVDVAMRQEAESVLGTLRDQLLAAG